MDQKLHTVDQEQIEIRLAASHCLQCFARIVNPAHGCLTCGPLVVDILGASPEPHPRALQAAQESAEAVIIVKRFLDALEDCEAGDPLCKIRKSVHAPLQAALSKALTKMIEPTAEQTQAAYLAAVWDKPEDISQEDWDYGDQDANIAAGFEDEHHRFVHGGHSGEHRCRLCGFDKNHPEHKRPSA